MNSLYTTFDSNLKYFFSFLHISANYNLSDMIYTYNNLI